MYKFISQVGSCVVLSVEVGTDWDGQPIPQFFVGTMMKDGKSWKGDFAEADIVRVSHYMNTFADAKYFAAGYDAAANTGRRSVMPQDWKFEQISTNHIRRTTLEEQSKLIYYPE